MAIFSGTGKSNCGKNQLHQSDAICGFLTRAAIDMRYVAGDLSSWADETTSPRADIKRLINRLDNCIAKLLAIRRATRRSWRLGNSRMKPQNQLVHSGQAASRASTNLLKGEIMSRAANPQTGLASFQTPRRGLCQTVLACRAWRRAQPASRAKEAPRIAPMS